ncbi:MAG: ATP-binding cassette domain-containing protein [Proteobacteria bacterium]|nr:ATP-binding cassette domain-containing protein [Pseudomonadota bacterium]
MAIYRNQVTTIIGKSGTGKSVLLKHIAGLLSPDEGEIFHTGNPLKKMKENGEWDRYRKSISYMFQGNALFDSMTVFENVALPLRQTTNFKKKEIEEKVMMRLGQIELAEVIDRYPSELSGGMQKRVALARALVTDPEIILFDEPTTGQDMVRRNVILSMIAHYKKQLGFTAILISHDIPDVLFISDRVILLWEGRVAFQGAYEDTIKLKHPMIDEFLQSIEGFKDELTGLLSKQMFNSRYAMTFGVKQKGFAGAAILFDVNFTNLVEHLGHQAAIDVVKTLGEHINHYMGAIDGFSTRQRTGQIITILPHITSDEARQFVADLAKKLQEDALPSIQSVMQAKARMDTCFEISVLAGITEADFSDDIEKILSNARSDQKIIAEYQCTREDAA